MIFNMNPTPIHCEPIADDWYCCCSAAASHLFIVPACETFSVSHAQTAKVKTCEQAQCCKTLEGTLLYTIEGGSMATWQHGSLERPRGVAIHSHTPRHQQMRHGTTQRQKRSPWDLVSCGDWCQTWVSHNCPPETAVSFSWIGVDEYLLQCITSNIDVGRLNEERPWGKEIVLNTSQVFQINQERFWYKDLCKPIHCTSLKCVEF